MRDLKKVKVEVPDDENFFSMMTTPEDWEGFKKLMEESDIQDKDLILRVLSMYSDPVVREREIRNIAEAFEEIKVKILPKLRRSVFTVKVEKIGWSDAELRQWVTQNMDTLVLEELLYTASLFDDNQTKLKLYSKAMEKYPKCLRAANNVGVIKLAMKDMDGAKKAFETAKAIKDHNIVKNNLGVIALRQGDIATAEQMFSAASGAGDEVNRNLAAIKIIHGDYDAAKSLLGSTQCYNNALVILLQGQPDRAYEMLRGLDTDHAMVDYLMAVAAARGDDKDAMLDALRAAVAKDAKLKEHAAKDIEFAAYFEDEAFKGIVQ
jgi:tetratricopeptide (TPR) repeat protein